MTCFGCKHVMAPCHGVACPACLARWESGEDPGCPDHALIKPAEAECGVCDCRWLIATGSAESMPAIVEALHNSLKERLAA